MLGCFSWTKRGTHDSLWPKRNQKMNGRRKRIEFKKIIVIGYAYLSQGKHITSELNRLLKPGYKRSNSKH